MLQNSVIQNLCLPILRNTKCHSILFYSITAPHIPNLLKVCTAFWSGLEELHSLVEQSETKAFPQISLLDQLRTVASEADKVATMAQQLLNGKRQTRYDIKRFSNSTVLLFWKGKCSFQVCFALRLTLILFLLTPLYHYWG